MNTLHLKNDAICNPYIIIIYRYVNISESHLELFIFPWIICNRKKSKIHFSKVINLKIELFNISLNIWFLFDFLYGLRTVNSDNMDNQVVIPHSLRRVSLSSFPRLGGIPLKIFWTSLNPFLLNSFSLWEYLGTSSTYFNNNTFLWTRPLSSQSFTLWCFRP